MKVDVCILIVRAGPRTLECGGSSGPDPEQSNTGYDVSGVSRKGGEYERGSPSHIGGRGRSPGKNLGNCGAREVFFQPVLGPNVRFQT